MKKNYLAGLALLSLNNLTGQKNPAITNWMINNSDITGRHYVSGNSTVIEDTDQANVQKDILHQFSVGWDLNKL